MSSFSKFLCLGLTFFLPFGTTQAELTGEVIYRPQINAFNELWMTNVDTPHNARRILKLEHSPRALAVQANGNLVVTTSAHDQIFFGTDIYLFDKEAHVVKERRLTRQQFGHILGIDISQNGDIVFTHKRRGPAPATGIYLIPKQELKRAHPNAHLIKEDEARDVEWSPNGRQIAYRVVFDGIFVFNILTQEVLQVSEDGFNPTFSPDGRHLAFAHKRQANTYRISIVSLIGPPNLKTVETQEGEHGYLGLKWSPDGQYIVYTIIQRQGVDKAYHNFAVPLNGGPHEKFLDIHKRGVWLFDWTHTAVTYTVEPTNKLTTLWGKLKQQD